jgi:hypothetical protein
MDHGLWGAHMVQRGPNALWVMAGVAGRRVMTSS